MAQSIGGPSGTGSNAAGKKPALPPPDLPKEWLIGVRSHTSDDGLYLILPERFNLVYAYEEAQAYVRIMGGQMWSTPLTKRSSDGRMQLGPGWHAFRTHYKIRKKFTACVIYEGHDVFELKVFYEHDERIMYYISDFRCACYGQFFAEMARQRRQIQTYERGAASNAAHKNPEPEVSVAIPVPLANAAAAYAYPVPRFNQQQAQQVQTPAQAAVTLVSEEVNLVPSCVSFSSDGPERARLRDLPTGWWKVGYGGREWAVEVAVDTSGNFYFTTGWMDFVEVNKIPQGAILYFRVPNPEVKKMEAVSTCPEALNRIS